MTTDHDPIRIRGWSELRHEDNLVIFVVVKLPDWLRRDDEAVQQDADIEGSAARWFGATLDGTPTLGLVVAELHGDAPRHASWVLPDAPQQLVGSASTLPHLIGLVADDEQAIDQLRSGYSLDPELLNRATHVDSHSPSDSILRLAWGLPDEVDSVEIVDAGDPEAIARETLPLRSRVALAEGEILDDNQVLPMAWRPWHYDLVEQQRGLRWTWPTQQIYFGLQHPSAVIRRQLVPPDNATAKSLRGYLATVRRLSRSMAVNGGGSIRWKWTRDDGDLPIEVEGPHEDALDAMLPHLRKLMDPNEESGFSFNRVQKALAVEAHRAGDVVFKDELRRWKSAEKGIRRIHHRALQYELAAELGDELKGAAIRGPLDGVPEIEPEALIRIYMYGETLHVKEGLQQIEEWDRDPTLGPLMRQEARGDAIALLHFYGAFATYVAEWLDAGQAEAA
ncbi:MAG: hypothetical protein WKF94_10510 [Solirubrobacteraceae bacterium]